MARPRRLYKDSAHPGYATFALVYMRREGWKHEERFEGGGPAALYALGVMLYQGLTDLHPFDPKLPDTTLVEAVHEATGRVLDSVVDARRAACSGLPAEPL